jgi:dTDP-4-dehydrorhamnose 3,5-epimerase
MQVQSLRIPDVKLLTPRRFADDRGWFSESYNQRTMATAGIELDFVQDNHSYSKSAGTVRGLHYQSPPFAQDKLVRVLSGRILDVVVDVRVGSPTYGQWLSAELTADGGEQLLVPIGFLHGFITLDAHTEVAYKVTARYSADRDGNVRWDDPALGIDWGELAGRAVLSEKDLRAPNWIEFESPFR